MEFKKFKDYSTQARDIVITLPSSIKWEEYEKELKLVEDESQVLNFKVSKLPISTSIGSKCYLCYNGNVIGWMKIVGLINGTEFDCTTTGQNWKGNFIQRSGKFNKLDEPIPMKGFQGFRYYN